MYFIKNKSGHAIHHKRCAQRQQQKFKMFEHNTQHSRKKKIDIAIYLIKYCFEDSYDYPTIITFTASQLLEIKNH